MEIRRVEPERIQPPAASEHGARAENTRRQRLPEQEKHRGREDEEQEHDASQEDAEDKPAVATVYQADGHLHEQPPPDGETHTIDFTV
ncbi:MAG: hypothetical protein ACYDCO_15640 [Armatimonadota bacterium]